MNLFNHTRDPIVHAVQCDVHFKLHSSLSSSSSPLCRVFIHIFPRQTMSLGNTLLQLFCRYC